MLMFKFDPNLPVVGVGKEFVAGETIPQELGVILKCWELTEPSKKRHVIVDPESLEQLKNVSDKAPAVIRKNREVQLGAASKALQAAQDQLAHGELSMGALPRVREVSAEMKEAARRPGTFILDKTAPAYNR